MAEFKFSIPWVLAQFGVRRWLAERAFRMPERYIAGWCEMLSKVTEAEITPARWRQIEDSLVGLVYGGVLVKVDG